ncbi:MAG: NAD(P)/FAD-dependent oxidoreductase, partial [Proteobacteria bacterium]|nr:NAD(P)/FAD-dependent oxidoreductase [Pseudomonadota bacterium]
MSALGAAALALPRWRARVSVPDVPTIIHGAAAQTGHRLRDGQFPPVTERRSTGVLIVGGGISGLSAAWRLHKRGYPHFELLELEPQPGGNSQHGSNQISAYPWGAHYV